MRYLAASLLLLLSACAHKAELKTPTQIIEAQKKAEARAVRDAERAKKRAEKEAARKIEEEKDSMEVTVPGEIY